MGTRILDSADVARIQAVVQLMKEYLERSDEKMPTAYRAIKPLDLRSKVEALVVKATMAQETFASKLCKLAKCAPGDPKDVWQTHKVHLTQIMEALRVQYPAGHWATSAVRSEQQKTEIMLG
ncbi:hypothetical protein DACRYDRAFT_112053 [Dacryopinax primogenitus]|uniref:Uncharacterized protein n=1 Tax=Dacryopinax primogenitus (strain DJM 731) TaxID=1858805 RepID=M5FUY2_DACPD|nr:uncharacterized protein DACRYDRAFT_112053 [Dacryopinax primogenitus]EJT97091.1 hypothetical protein DACRYDRAFT_112053 [Dacryopinax primogenitus]